MNTERPSIVAAKYFGWWFAWGLFSGIMILIVLKGGGLGWGTQLFVILGIAVLAGSVGLSYYVQKSLKRPM